MDKPHPSHRKENLTLKTSPLLFSLRPLRLCGSLNKIALALQRLLE